MLRATQKIPNQTPPLPLPLPATLKRTQASQRKARDKERERVRASNLHQPPPPLLLLLLLLLPPHLRSLMPLVSLHQPMRIKQIRVCLTPGWCVCCKRVAVRSGTTHALRLPSMVRKRRRVLLFFLRSFLFSLLLLYSSSLSFGIAVLCFERKPA